MAKKTGLSGAGEPAFRGRTRGMVKRLRCKGIVQTGKRKGKLKKGFKWPGGGKCPVKVKKQK